MAHISGTPRPKSPPPHVQEDEDRIFHDIIQGIAHLPEGLRRLDFRVGEDSHGDPAVFFIIVADDDLKPSKQKLEDIGRLRDEIRNAARYSDSNRYRFIRIETE